MDSNTGRGLYALTGNSRQAQPILLSLAASDHAVLDGYWASACDFS
jgi:hypothetical protein